MMRYTIKVYNKNFEELARFRHVVSASYELKLNEIWNCTFTLVKDDPGNKYCEPFNFIELYDLNERVELFRIMSSTLNRSDSAEITYYCEHVLSTLIDNVMFKYHQIGGLGIKTSQVLRYVLDKQTSPIWKLIECDFDRQFEYKWENENLLSALLSIPKPFNEKYVWKFDTTSMPFGLSLKKMQEEYVSDIQYKKNMQGIIKVVDPTNIITRLYALGYGEGDNQLTIKSVNNNIPYLEKNVGKYGLKETIFTDRRFESPETLKEHASSILEELSEPHISYEVQALDLSFEDKKAYPKYWPGDMVLIKDLEDEISVVMPIVSVSKYDIISEPYNVKVEIANKTKNIAGSISSLLNRTRINETYSQGATNLMQLNFNDNADESNPAKFKFYIPPEMARINKLILNYSFEAFRAYSKATEGGGARVQTTSSAGGAYISSESGGGQFSTTNSGGGVTATTRSGGGAGIGLTSNPLSTHTQLEWKETTSAGTPPHNHGLYVMKDHKHSMNIPDHVHEVDIPNHRHTFEIDPHTHRVNIPSHQHEIVLENHTHDIKYGIYQGGKADSAIFNIDGKSVNVSGNEINIIPYLSKDSSGKITRGTWHTVEIIPNRLTRINASLFIQLFTNSRGGGDF